MLLYSNLLHLCSELVQPSVGCVHKFKQFHTLACINCLAGSRSGHGREKMSKRAYPQDPSVPRQGTFPGGSGGYPGQGSYQGPTSQPGPPGGPQPPGGSGYPRQHYPAPGPSQGWVPSSSSNYGPGQPVHGGYNASQGQHHYTGGSYQPGPPQPPGPPAGQNQPPGPPTGQIRPPGPPTGQTRPASPPSATSMMGPPPPTVGVSMTPPTSVASMTTGVGQLHLGHQPAGNWLF